MAKKSEQMLIQYRVTPTNRIEENSTEVSIHEEHGYCSSEDRQ